MNSADKPSRPRNRVRRGIYLLPSACTTGNIFCGFYAMTASYRSLMESNSGLLEAAAVAIFIALLIDWIDGWVARTTGSSSEFGREFDSLADVISFGVAPAYLSYVWAFTAYGRVGWLFPFLFVVCGTMRLARFNIKSVQQEDKRYFVGLPIPAGAALLAGLVLNFPEYAMTGSTSALLSHRIAGVAMMALVALISFLMVSKLRYRSFKEIDSRGRKSYFWVFLLALAFVAVASHPTAVPLLLAGTYVLSAPLSRVYRLIRYRTLSPTTSVRDQGDTHV